jgi:type I restriction enzyme S subunit
MILIETSGSKCGRSVLLTKKMLDVFARPVVFSNFCRTLRIELEKLMNKYAELWFSHAYATGLIPSYRATSAMPNLDIKSLLRIEKILIPPLSEQKRIVDVVKSVDTYIAAAQQQAADARAARNAVLHELLTTSGADWTETTLGELVDIQKGKKPPVLVDISTIGQPYLTADVLRGSAPSQFVPQYELTACVQLQGKETILLWDGAGAGDAFRSTAGVLASTMARLSIKSISSISAEYLYLVVINASPAIKSSCRGTTVPHVSPDALTALPLRLPPLSEQNRIVETVSAMDDAIRSTEQVVCDAQRLRSGLLSDLLSGDHEIPESYDRLLGAA